MERGPSETGRVSILGLRNNHSLIPRKNLSIKSCGEELKKMRGIC